MVALFYVEVGSVGASEGTPDGDVGDGERVSDEVGPQDEVIVKLLESGTGLFKVSRGEAGKGEVDPVFLLFISICVSSG